MKFFVGVTDNQWFDYLRRLSTSPTELLDEVNFWLPGSIWTFKILKPEELFLFRLKSSLICAFGIQAPADAYRGKGIYHNSIKNGIVDGMISFSRKLSHVLLKAMAPQPKTFLSGVLECA